MVGGTIRRKVIHRESFRASVLHPSEIQAVLQSIAEKKCLLTRPSLLSTGTHERASLYDGVGSVKGHVEFASREGLFFSSPKRNSSLSFISTKARFVNRAVETGSTNHLFDHPPRGTMIRSSDAAIARGSKAPNQPSDELAFTRVAPGLPCLRTSCA